MIDDRNKTELTRNVTAAVCRYLDERGFKPIETEVPIQEGWVADIAGVLTPTLTELQELRLLPRKPGYRNIGYQEWHDKAKQVQQLMTALVEVKTSRADFRGDKKWTLPIPVNLAYLAIPSSLSIPMEEMPIGWGVLEYIASTDSVRFIRAPRITAVSVEQQLRVAVNVAVRRDHHTRYERHREFQKAQRKITNEQLTLRRVHACMRAVISIANGHSWGMELASVEQALEYFSIRKLPAHDIEELHKLWRIAAPQTVSANGKRMAAEHFLAGRN